MELARSRMVVIPAAMSRKALSATEMLVHVPQAGQQHLAGAVDDLRAGCGGLAAFGFDADDALAANGDALCRHGLRRRGIEDRHVLDDEVARGMMNELLGQAGGARRLHFVLRLQQRAEGALEPCANQARPALHSGEALWSLIEPEICRAEVEAVDLVERGVHFLAVGFDRNGLQLLQRGFAPGEQRQLAAILQQRLRQAGNRTRGPAVSPT